MGRYYRAYGLILTSALVLVLIYWVGLSNYRFILVASNILFPLIAGAAALVSFMAARRYGWKGGIATAISGFFLASLLWFLAELTWTIYVLVFGVEVPYPSLVDVFYIAGYVVCYVAFTLYLDFFRESFSKRLIPLLLAVAVAFSLTVVFFLLQPLTVSTVEPLEKALNITYPILDILLFTASLAGLLVFLSGRISIAWMFLSLSFLMDTAADVSFSYVDLLGLYYEGHLVELPFLWAYLIFILAFWIHLKEL